MKSIEVHYSIKDKSYTVRPNHIFQYRGKKPIAIVDIDKTISVGGTTEYLYRYNRGER